MDVYEVLSDIMGYEGLSIAQVAKKCGLPDSTVRGIVTRKQKTVSLDVAYKLSDGLGVSLERLNGMEEPTENKERSYYETHATDKEFENIVKKYRLISEYSPGGASVVDTVLDRECEIAKKLKEQKEQLEKIQKMDMEVAEKIVPKRILAYYGKIAAAGKSYGFDDVIAGTIECPLTDKSQRADYVIGISGDSMEPTFCDGDIVYVSKTALPGIGDIGIFQKDNGIYIKEVGENELISHNPDYRSIVNNGDILCLGKVIGKIEED